MKLNWVNSLDLNNSKALLDLEARMSEYYRTLRYYEEIRSGLSVWQSDSPYYEQIVQRAKNVERVLEVGCGEAGILQANPGLGLRYTGVDFSADLMKQNQNRFPDSNFRSLSRTYEWPVEEEAYDMVFSVFVLEHVVRPHLFLDEACRVLRQGGRLVILCPDYFGYDRMASQRLGHKEGTGREKLKQGRFFDALITGWQTRIALPRKMWKMKDAVPGAFWINLEPICFHDAFRPDVDAVFVTDRDALVRHLNDRFDYVKQSAEIERQCANDRFIFLEFIKR